MLANYLMVPAVTILLLLLFQANALVAAGFLVLAVCPGAPFVPLVVGIAKGKVPVAVGLMVILAGSSAVISPLLLHALLPWLSAGETLRLDASAMVGTLVVTQLLPLFVGLLVNHARPQLAARLAPPFEIVSKILNLCVLVVIPATQFTLLMDIRLAAFGGMLALLVASLLIGWLAGGTRPRGPQDHGVDDVPAQRRCRPGHRNEQFRRHARRARGTRLRDHRRPGEPGRRAVVGPAGRRVDSACPPRIDRPRCADGAKDCYNDPTRKLIRINTGISIPL